jgi:hypothetical protein
VQNASLSGVGCRDKERKLSDSQNDPRAIGLWHAAGSDAQRLLDDSEHYDRMARAKNPFGDGEASSRIVAAVRNFFDLPTAIRPFVATAPS